MDFWSLSALYYSLGFLVIAIPFFVWGVVSNIKTKKASLSLSLSLSWRF
ncbi:MAG: hypothetical protein LBC44_01100 [Mycoplasmataceae bacterium]|nr:hypothetical protein [Mycoplasmataceae bacterium]